MKIGVNGRFLLKPFTGIGQYTIEMLRNLLKGDEYLVVVPEKLPEDLRMKFGGNVVFKVLKELRLPSAGMRKTWWEQVQLAEFFVKEKVEVAFYPYPGQPWTKDFYEKVRTVVTVHDCIPWMDKRYRQGFLSKLYNFQSKRSLHLVQKVVTVSDESKKDLMQVCGLEEEKVEVIYNGTAEVYDKSVTNEGVLEKFGLKKKGFYLYVGGYDKRKNVDFMLGEFESFGGKRPLVLAGGKVLKSKLYGSFSATSKAKEVIKTGFLEEEDLHCLYVNCLAFVNLSEAEGFNLPVLEAAKSGAVLVISDIPVHREIYGEAAIFVDISRKGKLGKALELLNDEGERRLRKKASKSLGENFSFEKAARKMKDVLNSV